MHERPGSLEALRRQNRLRVLEVLRRRASVSRAELERETGLSRTSVSSIVSTLLAEGVVVERPGGRTEGRSRNGGRPPTLLALDPAGGVLVGIDFGHDLVRVALADLAYAVLDEHTCSLDVDRSAREAIAAAVAMTRALLAEHAPEQGRALAAGVAVSAPVQARTNVFASPAIFPSWSGLDLQTELGDPLGLPVFVGNDANLGALSEAMLGAGRGVDNLIYVMLSTGVGAGLVLEGRVYAGETGTAGELGHVVVEPNGLVCRCGNRGCLETVAGATALVDALRHSHGTDIRLEDVLGLAADGDVGARRVIADAGRAVGGALAGVCSLLDPRLVVVGGALAVAGNLLLDGIRESIERAMTPSAGHGVDVVPGEFGARAPALGAIVLAATTAPIALPAPAAVTRLGA